MKIPVSLCFVLSFTSGSLFAASKKQMIPEPAAPAQMHVDPAVLNEYRNHTAMEANSIQHVDLELISVEPAIDVYDLQKLQAKNDYFTVPVEASGRTLVAPRVWIGMPRGWELAPDMFLRLGVDLSYLNREGAQTLHQEPLNMDVRDNITVHVFPIIPTANWSYVLPGSGTGFASSLRFGPWASAGVGTAMTQITCTLDGVSQSGWTPISRLAGGLSLGGSSPTLMRSVQAGVFSVSGSSQRLEWRSRGFLVGATFVL